MAKQYEELALGIPVFSVPHPSKACRKPSLLLGASSASDASSSLTNELCKLKRPNLVLEMINKLGKEADVFASSLWEHVRFSGKIYDTVKGKLRFRLQIVKTGGVERVFRKLFDTREGEKLLKASQCSLSTSSGPLVGLLFISSERIAFSSERSLKLFSPNGQSARIHYKVIIPLTKINSANQSENALNPYEKYLKITTVDSFDFWFMGVLNFQKTYKYIRQSISEEVCIS